MCFMDKTSGDTLRLNYEKKIEEIEQYKIVKFTFSVTIPHAFFQNGQHLKYFYYQKEANNNSFEKNTESESRKFREVSLKNDKNNVVDGLAFFRQIELASDELKSIKCKILRSLIDLEHLWHQSICMEFNRLIKTMNTIFEDLCLNDLEYKNEFEKVNKIFNFNRKVSLKIYYFIL